MEVRIEAADGQSAPDETYIAFRMGSCQKQARFVDKRRFSFPDMSNDERKRFGRIEIFRRVGSATVDFENFDGKFDDLEIPCKDLELPLMHLRLALITGKDATPATKPPTRTPKARARLDDAQRYMREHQLDDLLAQSLREVIRERPKDPHQYLSGEILRRGARYPQQCLDMTRPATSPEKQKREKSKETFAPEVRPQAEQPTTAQAQDESCGGAEQPSAVLPEADTSVLDRTLDQTADSRELVEGEITKAAPVEELSRDEPVSAEPGEPKAVDKTEDLPDTGDESKTMLDLPTGDAELFPQPAEQQEASSAPAGDETQQSATAQQENVPSANAAVPEAPEAAADQDVSVPAQSAAEGVDETPLVPEAEAAKDEASGEAALSQESPGDVAIPAETAPEQGLAEAVPNPGADAAVQAQLAVEGAPGELSPPTGGASEREAAEAITSPEAAAPEAAEQAAPTDVSDIKKDSENAAPASSPEPDTREKTVSEAAVPEDNAAERTSSKTEPSQPAPATDVRAEEKAPEEAGLTAPAPTTVEEQSEQPVKEPEQEQPLPGASGPEEIRQQDAQSGLTVIDDILVKVQASTMSLDAVIDAKIDAKFEKLAKVLNSNIDDKFAKILEALPKSN